MRTSHKFQDKYHQPPREGTAAKHFLLPHVLLLVLLLLLCGIPYCKLIKTRQPIVASDKREGNTLHRVHRFLNTYYLFDSFLIAKYFHGQILPQGEQPLAVPPLTLCVLVFLFTREKKELGGGVSLPLCHNETESLAFSTP